MCHPLASAGEGETMKFKNLDVEVVSKLVRLGFTYRETEDGNQSFVRETGSISNWTRFIIKPAFDESSLAHDEEYMPCVYMTYESEQAPGYAELDWQHKSEGKVVIADLFTYLESKGVSEQTAQERMVELRYRLQRKKEISSKLESIGLTLDDIKEVL